MNISKIERVELVRLSKEAFGRPSYWRKLLDRGVSRLAVNSLTKEPIQPVKVGRRGRVVKFTYVQWFNDINDLKTYMTDIIAKKAALLEDMKAGVKTEAK